MTRKNNTLSFSQKYEIAEALKGMADAEGHVHIDSPELARRFAKKVGVPILPRTMVRILKDVKLTCDRMPTSSPIQTLYTRVDELAERVAALEELLTGGKG